jgi:hypothetical protein
MNCNDENRCPRSHFTLRLALDAGCGRAITLEGRRGTFASTAGSRAPGRSCGWRHSQEHASHHPAHSAEQAQVETLSHLPYRTKDAVRFFLLRSRPSSFSMLALL